MSQCFLVLTVAARQARSAGEAFSRSVATPIW